MKKRAPRKAAMKAPKPSLPSSILFGIITSFFLAIVVTAIFFVIGLSYPFLFLFLIAVIITTLTAYERNFNISDPRGGIWYLFTMALGFLSGAADFFILAFLFPSCTNLSNIHFSPTILLVLVVAIVLAKLLSKYIILLAKSLSSSFVHSKIHYHLFIIIFSMVSIILIFGFSISTFCKAQYQVPTCISSSEFVCNNIYYSQTTGNVLITVSQNAGQPHYASAIAFAPQGTSLNSSGVPILTPTGGNVYWWPIGGSNNLITGKVIQENIPATGTSVTSAVDFGTSLSGSVWLCYSNSNSSQMPSSGICTGNAQYVKVATLNTQAS